MPISEIKFQVGDKVWWARLESRIYRITCPDCQGQKFLTVTLGDGSQVTVDCSSCERGYRGSLGYNEVYQYDAAAQLAEVQGVEIRFKELKYGLQGSWNVDAEDIFADEQSAKERAIAKAKELSERALEDFYKREKPTHSLAWNVTYHRGCLKRAQKDIEYHSAKLAVALQHKKLATQPEAVRCAEVEVGR